MPWPIRPRRRFEVYRDPIPDGQEPNGYRYANRTDVQETGTVHPLAAATAPVAVADLLA